MNINTCVDTLALSTALKLSENDAFDRVSRHTCPICSAKGITLYTGSGPYGGPWVHCRLCQFCGDAVDLWQAVTKEHRFEVAVDDMRQKGVIVYGVTKENIEESHQVQSARASLNKAYLATVDHLSHFHPPSGHLLQRYGIGGRNPQRLARLVGCWSRRPESDSPLSSIKESSLLVPLCTAPGAIARFYVMPFKDPFVTPVFKASAPSGSNGLSFLDRVPPDTKAVYVIGDVFTALALHTLYIETAGEIAFLPVVGSQGWREQPWQQLPGSKIVFWDYADRRTQAAKSIVAEVPRAKIANYPVLTSFKSYEEAYRAIAKIGVLRFISDLKLGH